MTRRGSLRTRLTAVAVLATALVIVVVVVAFNLLLARTLDRQVDDRLRTQAAAVATTVRIAGDRVTVRASPGHPASARAGWGSRPGRAGSGGGCGFSRVRARCCARSARRRSSPRPGAWPPAAAAWP